MGELHFLNVTGVDVVTIFYIFADYIDVQLGHDFVGSNNEIPIIYMNKINSKVRFNASESLVEISNVFTRRNHELISVAVVHKYNDLFL